MISRRTILLKPMQTGLSGYLRWQEESGRLLMSLHARGLEDGMVRLYACLTGQAARELAKGQPNAQGEVSLEAELTGEAERLQGVALIAAGEQPKPLLIGLCKGQSTGDVLEMRNAALALCDRLKPRPRPAEPEPQLAPVRCTVQAKKHAELSEPLPREIFLPAIDPSAYLTAVQPAPKPEPEPEPILPPPRPAGPAADRLRPLRWPRGFEMLKPYFDKEKPSALFGWRGWRFVPAARGLWIGIRTQDGRVCRIAYACQGTKPPPASGRYQPVKALDGQWYQVLQQEV